MGGGASNVKNKYAAKEEMRVTSLLNRLNDLQHPRSILTADVGGATSRFHVFRPPSDPNARVVPVENVIAEQVYSHDKYDSFEIILKEFLSIAQLPEPPLLACLAVSAYVVDNRCRLSKTGWDVDASALEVKFGIAQVNIVNRTEARGYGALTLDTNAECDVLHHAPRLEGAPMAIIAAGEGLGEAYLTVGEHGEHEVWPTEGGHAEFAPRQNGSDRLQFELCNYLMIKFSAKARISVERIVSGKGIANIYQFLSWKFPDKVNKNIHRKFLGVSEKNANDPAVIVAASKEGSCELCEQTLDIFSSAFGAEAGVLALQYMPFGGLFITGSLATNLRDSIMGQGDQESSFMTAFMDKGRVSPVLQKIPIFLASGEDLGERGVQLLCLRLLKEVADTRRYSRGHMFTAPH